MTSPARVAIVTGPSRGIGLATSLALARRGLSIAMWGHPSEELTAAARAVAEVGPVEVFGCDVADDEQVNRAAHAVVERFGSPAVVVNNAGIVHRGPTVAEIAVADWDRVIAVNLRGPFLVSRALLPSMTAASRGRLVAVSSISATIGCAGAAAYAASKWGLVGLAKSLAEELRGTGVTSLAVLPGSVDTRMLEGSGFAPRMNADEVAALIVYAALDAPDAMNGSAIEMFG